MPLDRDVLGRTTGPVESMWTPDDALLYALAVGAGRDDPTAELAVTTEHTEGVPQRVLPMFAVLIGHSAGQPALGDHDPTRTVHAEQEFTVTAPLPPSGRVRAETTVTELLDKGSGALVRTETRIEDASTGELVAMARSGAFLIGEGGFGGERGARTVWEPPRSEPDHTVRLRTGPEQALLYRLTGDRNPLHSDPAFAARGGFPSPILHGLCTYGFTGRALIRVVCGGDPTRLRGMGGRFTAPVVPGDALAVEIWADAGGVLFRTRRGDGTVVIDQGRAVVAG